MKCFECNKKISKEKYQIEENGIYKYFCSLDCKITYIAKREAEKHFDKRLEIARENKIWAEMGILLEEASQF